MELRQLNYFVKVAEMLNFSEAARILCVTQSTLSQQIKQLEESLGTQLLVRTSHSVTLTEAGSELLPFARRTIQDADLCRDRINDLNGMKTGSLNIGITYSFSHIMTETLLTFMRQYPHIRLQIFHKPMNELMDMLKSREVDFVLAFKAAQPVEGVKSHELFQSCLAVIVNPEHPLAKAGRVTLAELKQYDLALPSRGIQARNALECMSGFSDQEFKVRLELNEVNILLKLIQNSKLATVLAKETIHSVPGVTAVELDVPDGEMTACVHVLRNAYRKQSMLEFINLLSDSLAVKVRQNEWLV